MKSAIHKRPTADSTSDKENNDEEADDSHLSIDDLDTDDIITTKRKTKAVDDFELLR